MTTLSKDSWTTVASGTFTSNGATLQYYIQAKLNSQSIANNTSKVDIRARTKFTGYVMGGAGYSFSCTGCTTSSGSGVIYYNNSAYTNSNPPVYHTYEQTVLTGSKTVTHSSNGTGSLSMSGACTNQYLGMSISVSDSVDLPKIDRISVITSFNAFTIEDGLSFSYTDYLANKTLSLDIKVGSTTVRSETYTSVVGAHSASITFTQAELTAIYNAMSTSAKSATFTLSLTTSGITTASTATATGTLKESVNKPTVDSISLTEQALTSYGVGNDTVVQYLSQKLVIVTVTTKNNATVSSVMVNNGTISRAATLQSGNTYAVSMSNLTSGIFTVTVTDSRGFYASQSATKTFLAYVYPAITSAEMDRDSNIVTTGYINVSGTFWNDTAGSTTNTIRWTYKLNSLNTSGQQSVTATNSTWNGSVSLTATEASNTLERNTAYDCLLTATDAFGQSATYTVSIGIAVLALWLGKYTVRASGVVTEKLVIHNPFTGTDELIGGYLDVGTYTNETYYGVGGYITSGGAAAVLTIPVGLLGFENLSLTKIGCGIRSVDGSYLKDANNNTDLISYLDLTNHPDDLMYLPRQGILRVVLRNSSGWGITNNSPVFGDVILSYTISS